MNNFNSRALQNLKTFARVFRIRIGCPDDDLSYSCGDDGFRARRRAAVRATRFEGDVERSALRPLARDPQGLDFGMGLAEPPMKALADDLGPLGDYATDHRVWLDEPLPPDGEFQSATNMPKVDFVLLHGEDSRCQFTIADTLLVGNRMSRPRQ